MSDAVLLPVYNEADTVTYVLDAVREHFDGEILIVDDGSTDGTHTVLLSRADITLIAHPTNLGYGRALAEGCQENSLERAACLAYMEGYAHGFVSNDRIMTAFLRDNVQSGHLEVSAPAKRVDKPAYCADDEMPGEAIRAAYLGWAAGHPDELDQPAASALFLALAEAFPCSGPPLADASYQSASWQP